MAPPVEVPAHLALETVDLGALVKAAGIDYFLGPDELLTLWRDALRRWVVEHNIAVVDLRRAGQWPTSDDLA